MTKFELPEKPKKTNTSEDFNNLRKAVDELDKFDYAWKTYANKADRRINAANKYIEELERENQRLKAENLSIKTLLENAKKQPKVEHMDYCEQQALPVVPSFVAEWYEFHMNGTFSAVVAAYAFAGDDKAVVWLGENGGMDLLCKMKLYGFKVEKPQLFYLKNKLTESYLYYDEATKLYSDIVGNVEDFFGIKTKFTQTEIDSMETGSYELVPVEDGE